MRSLSRAFCSLDFLRRDHGHSYRSSWTILYCTLYSIMIKRRLKSHGLICSSALVSISISSYGNAFSPYRSPCRGLAHHHQDVTLKRRFLALVSMNDNDIAFQEELPALNLSLDSQQSVQVSQQPNASSATCTPTATFSEKLKLGFITCSSILMLVKLYQISGAGTWKYYLAGGMCAAISHTVPVPIDVVKTRKQVDPSLKDAALSEAFRKIIQKDGWGVLLDGLGPTTFGYMVR
jgi:hypothetical protein